MHKYMIREQADGSERITQTAANGRRHPREADYPDLLKALAEDGTPRVERIPYVAPEPAPEPTPLELLQASDFELVRKSARAIEDFLDERIAAGKTVSAEVKEEIAKRKALRAEL